MTTCCLTPCENSNALTWLLCPNPVHVETSVKVLGEEAQERKCSLAETFLQHIHGEQCIQVLMQLLNSQDAWLCSMAVYIFGVLLENEDMVQKLQEWTHGDNGLCWALGQLLEKDEHDVVLNAAGAIASLVETPSGRQWLLQDSSVFSQVLENVTCLLIHERENAVNSAALILAWLSLCETACQKLLSHSSASKILSRLAHCLAYSHKDTAMNAAFTIGRLCGSEQGKRVILAKAQDYRLANSLQTLLSNGAGPEAGQAACFALSCLASEDDGHTLLMENSSCPELLNGLLSLLKSADPDSTWFAAMTLRVFVSRPSGVIRVREHSYLEEQLKYLSLLSSTGRELQEEISACLRKLRRLPKPSPITVQHLCSGACIASWERQEPESGLEVTYSLFDGDTVLYCGLQCQVTLPYSHLRYKQCLSLRLNLSTSDGDVSPFSDLVEMTVERPNLRPGTPEALRVIGCTDTQVHLSWMEPNGEIKPKSFQVYCDDVLVETATELGTTVSCLSPSTTYTLSVCALGPGDTAGPRSSIAVQTDECYDHAPRGLTVAVQGRHELHISWGAPVAPLGRIFNYELRLNGFVVYLGTERAHTARRLTANTAYTCTVTAITSRGRCQSRPVTKRTAKDGYMNVNRSLYSPSRQPISHPLPSPPDTEVNEVKSKARKSLLHKRPPNVQLTVPHHTDPDLRKDRHRLPSVSVPSHNTEKSKSNLMSEEQGLVSKLDVKAMWNRARDASDAAAFPVNASDCPVVLRQERHERTQRSQQLSDSALDLSNSRSKISPDVLWGSGRLESDMRRLPVISQPITGSVRLLQPISYHWPDLERTEQHHKKSHRNRLGAGSRLHSQLKGRQYLTSSWTKT
ncbi:uncharacterized protein LOC107197743 isoform X1 [Astyanax mexicanus]|uniref:uncharacterized protein LOC107197743 isoform X1 n=1 Tax=Astyanax mexicanus TaxID=7994 RepID=UPI0020CAFBD9|nr:uncharacterized protein LOC107197743 isoform X1 [Astyanax mexicanus]